MNERSILHHCRLPFRAALSAVLLLQGVVALPAAPFTVRPVASNDVAGNCPVTAADFDADGFTEWYGGGGRILKFPRSGSIVLPVLTLPASPASVTPVPKYGICLDADNDGDMDIARINDWNGDSTQRTLQVFLNNGAGVFAAGYRIDWAMPSGYNYGATHYRMAAADFDTDGDPDLAVLSTYDYPNSNVSPRRNEGSLVVRWNDGTGQFSSATTLQSLHFSSRSGLAVSDWDHDGDPDIAVTLQQLYNEDGNPLHGAIRLFSPDADGTFTVATISTTTDAGAWLADINRDGWDDLLTRVGVSGSNPRIRLNNGSGTFNGSWETAGQVMNGIMDANRDSRLDLLILHTESSGGSVTASIQTAEGNGSGGFATPATVATLNPGSYSAINLWPADADGDGDEDIVAVRHGDSTAIWYLENRAQRPAVQQSLPASLITTAPDVEDLAVADVNHDGIDDLLATAPGAQRLYYLAGTGTGDLAPYIFKNTPGAAPGRLVPLDADADGDVDVAYTLPVAGKVRLARQTVSNFFSWSDAEIASIAGADLITSGTLGTANGRPDLLVSSTTTGQTRWLYDTSGNATTWLGQTIYNSFTPPPRAIIAAPASDGTGDEVFLLGSDDAALKLRCLKLQPAWTLFGSMDQSKSPAGTSQVLAWADMLPGGRRELVFVDGSGRLVFWSPELGNNLLYSVDEAPPGEIRAIAVTDWDRDGREDLLCAGSAGVMIYSRQSGTWKLTHREFSGYGFADIVAIDLNRDGWMDAAASSPAGGRIHRFINRAPVASVESVTAENPAIEEGAAGNVLTVAVRNPGRPADPARGTLAESDIVVTADTIRFFKASPASGGGWTPGAAMTKSEVEQAVYSVSLMASGNVIGTSGTGGVDANGALRIEHHPVLGSLQPVAPGSAQSLTFRLTLKTGAASAHYQRFYVARDTIHAASSVTLMDGATPALTSPLYADTVYSLVTIVPDYTPLELWRTTHFGTPQGTGSAANDADWDGDGVLNLTEYVTGTDPRLAEPAVNAARALTMDLSAGPAAFALARLWLSNAALTDPSIRLTIQRSSDLNSWITVATRSGAAAWTVSTPATLTAGGFTSHTFTLSVKPSTTPRQWIRLRVEELP